MARNKKRGSRKQAKNSMPPQRTASFKRRRHRLDSRHRLPPAVGQNLFLLPQKVSDIKVPDKPLTWADYKAAAKGVASHTLGSLAGQKFTASTFGNHLVGSIHGTPDEQAGAVNGLRIIRDKLFLGPKSDGWLAQRPSPTSVHKMVEDLVSDTVSRASNWTLDSLLGKGFNLYTGHGLVTTRGYF